MFMTAPVRFVGSLTFGLILLTILLALMALGTFIESEYGSAVAQSVIYGNFLFQTLMGLLALNLTFSILKRFPWRRYYIPFLLTHVGILILLLGCFMTWQRGEEAQITLAEGTVGNAAVKPEQKQLEFKYVLHSPADAPEPVRVPVSLGPFSWRDYQYENWIKDDKRYKTFLWYAMKFISRTTKFSCDGITVDILDYHANSTLEPVPPFDVSVLWNKTVQTISELGETKEAPRNWEQVRLDLRQRHGVSELTDVRGVNGMMSQGERISYCLAASQEELTAFQKSRPKGGNNAGLWGEIVLYYSGSHYSVNVDQLIAFTDNSRFEVEGSGLQIGAVRFSERGPIIRFTVFTQNGKHATMALMPDNPELNVQAREQGIFGSYWVDPHRIMQQSSGHAEHPMLKRLAMQRLDFMQGPDKKLYYRLWSGQKIIADGVVPDRGTQKKPQFKVAEQTPHEAEIIIDRFIPQDFFGGRIVPAPTSRMRQNEHRLKLCVVFEGKEDIFWIRATEPTVVPLLPEQDQIHYVYGNGKTLCVQLNFETIDLGFGILLKQFEKHTEPGTQMPSRFSSLIDYVEPVESKNAHTSFSRDLTEYRALPGGENVLISMNRPGYFFGKRRGYRIYQSSYLGPFYPDQPQLHELYDGSIFPWETRPRESVAMSTLSVNADPGRKWKYFGSFLIVLGTALFIKRKRW